MVCCIHKVRDQRSVGNEAVSGFVNADIPQLAIRKSEIVVRDVLGDMQNLGIDNPNASYIRMDVGTIRPDFDADTNNNEGVRLGRSRVHGGDCRVSCDSARENRYWH